jgi:DNA repair protein RadC
MMQNVVDIVSLKMVRERPLEYDVAISSPSDLIDLVHDLIGSSDREQFIVVCVDTKNKPTNISFASTGSLNSAIAHPREILKTAILSNAHQIFLAHNHPSGNTKPSPDDDRTTEALIKCCDMMKINLVDHVIVTDVAGRYYSYRQEEPWMFED